MAFPTTRPQVVIVGGGFGGLAAAKALAGAAADVTLVDRTNHHVFQPLLYQVATAGLSPAEIASPIRHILRRQQNARVLLGEVTAVEPAARRVHLETGGLAYDFLILATGVRHSYFGNAAWEAHAPGLKTLGDALDMRQRMLLAFERAEWTADEAERRAFDELAKLLGRRPFFFSDQLSRADLAAFASLSGLMRDSYPGGAGLLRSFPTLLQFCERVDRATAAPG